MGHILSATPLRLFLMKVTDIYQIMRSLGHEKIETTMIYLEKIFEKERHAIHGWNPEVFGEYI